MITVFHALLLYSRYLNTRLIKNANLLFFHLSNPSQVIDDVPKKIR